MAVQANRITGSHVAHYHEHGYAVVERFCSPAELDGALADFEAVVPGWLAYVNDPAGPKPESWDKPYPGQRGKPHFPYAGETLNQLTVHPELRQFASANAGGQEVYCEQSHLTYKGQGHRADVEQRMHLDYVNHTLAYPPDDPTYWQTAFIYYFTDVDAGSAPTAVCSWQHTPEKILWPSHYSKSERPEVYDHEVKIEVPAGSLLMYSMRTFHRGTSFSRLGGRLGMFVTYAPSAYKWLGIVGWSQEAPRADFRRWLESATPEERTSIGFPAPGDAYWNAETLAGVQARYPNMDMTPYR